MRKLLVLLIVCGLVLLVFSASASANPKARPFRGYVVGTVTFSVPNPAPAPAPPWLLATSNAVGDVSHMGETVIVGKHVPAMNFSGTMTLTAANGDMITCTYVGGGSLPPNIGDWYDIWCDATITGGTGRFTGATGMMDMTVTLRFLPMDTVWPAIWAWTGTIKY